ncbi:MAG: type II secretion system secretin GspD [Nevskiales bacterium]
MFKPMRALILAGGVALLATLAAQAQEDFTLNFQDADIATLIATVSELTGRNFVVDPRVKANVTVISATPMDAEGVYATFLSILQVHGFAAIPAGDVTKIVPEIIAKQEAGAAVSDGRRYEDMVTQVIELKNVSSTQLVAILRPLVPQAGHLAAYAPANMLIISDRSANVKRMTQIIERMDQTGDAEIEVVSLENASAAEIVRVVTGLNLGAEAKKTDPSAQGVAVIADERTNSVLISGDKSERLRVRSIITHLDTPVEQAGGTQVVYLRYAKAEDLAKILEGYAEQVQVGEGAATAAKAAAAGGATSSGGGGSFPGVRILPDPDTNALVITAPPKTMRAIKSVIEQLDIRRAQVLVEAIIAEVSINKQRDLGIDFAVFDNEDIAAAGLLSLDPAQVAAAVAAGSPAGLLRSGLNLAGGYSKDGTEFVFLLRALAGDGNTNILSTPTLITLDNEEAEIKVGQEVPFLTGSFTNTGSGTPGAVNPFQTIERRDVGLTLKITPQINEGDTVQLKIEQETSSIAAGGSGQSQAQDLITNRRTISTVVLVESGATLVLGGLIDDNVTENETKIPLLGDIPIIGNLFKSQSVRNNKQNLMVFIRPVILRSNVQADYYTRRKYDFVRSKQLENIDDTTLMIRKKEKALLPETLPSGSGPPSGAAAPIPPAPDGRTSPVSPVPEPPSFKSNGSSSPPR